MFRLDSKYASGVKFLQQKRFTGCQYLFNIQVLTITIKLSYVIKYVSQNFSVRDLRGQITKSIYQAPYLLPGNFPNNFSHARSHFNRMERLLIRQKLILKFHSKKKTLNPWTYFKKYTVCRKCEALSANSPTSMLELPCKNHKKIYCRCSTGF